MPGPRQHVNAKRSGHDELDDDQEPALLEDVGEHSTDHAEEKVGKHVGDLHERNEERCLSPMDQ